MIASERKLYILRALEEKGVINLKEIAQAMGISEATVRRDFEKLEQEGRLTRVQGGAMRSGGLEQLETAQSSMTGKKNLHRGEKMRIAMRAAELVQDGDSVYLDCGTSLAPLGELLLRRRVHIVTNSTLMLAHDKDTAATVFVLGGQLDAQNYLLHGPLTKTMIGEFHFNHAFVSCFGVSLDQRKAYTLELASAEVKQAGMDNADRCHLLLDHSKLGRSGFYAFADLSRFDTAFSDRAPGLDPLPDNVVLLKDEKK